mmetsp:Transcript_64411/g.54624  ORF Transcript_64411/g.54624 Transcript_64411/m.54624 type:complete len:118 (+) Transcript_64411:100-453(+)
MALTGFTRSGECVDENDDAGSHHICINLKSTKGGNFCEQTGQSNWCDGEMTCNSGKGLCSAANWCVCEWAFVKYISKAGGCSMINDIKCSAINKVVLKHYKNKLDQSGEITKALNCI